MKGPTDNDLRLLIGRLFNLQVKYMKPSSIFLGSDLLNPLTLSLFVRLKARSDDEHAYQEHRQQN